MQRQASASLNSAAMPGPLACILHERASFELRDEDVEALRKKVDATLVLKACHSGQLAEAEAAKAKEAEEMRAWKADHPCLLENFLAFLESARQRRVAVFLDYDGTLTPIVKNPDRAYMSDQMRAAVRATARLFPTAIISGRGREKVESFVQLKELYYAGSHGMDIVGPRGDQQAGEALAFQPAARYAPIMDQVYEELVTRVAGIPGATVEHNKFCVSVHFRNCEAEKYNAVLGAVEATLRSRSELHASRGRKVFEIKPQVDWHKGCALVHLLGALGLGEGEADVLPIYIGDDRTDEDAFRVLRERPAGGVGILVSSKAKPTQAAYTLRDPAEVLAFLTRLVGWGRTPASAWHARPACVGWALNLAAPPAEAAAASPFPAADAASSGSAADDSPAAAATRHSDAGATGASAAAMADAGSDANGELGAMLAGKLPPLRPSVGRPLAPAAFSGGSPASAAAAAGREALLGGSANSTPRGRPPLPRPPSVGGLAAFAAAGGGSAGPGSAGPGPLSPLALSSFSRENGGDAPVSPPAPWRDVSLAQPLANAPLANGALANGAAAPGGPGGSGHGCGGVGPSGGRCADRLVVAGEAEAGYTFGGLGLGFLGRTHSLESNGGMSNFSGCYSLGGETLFFNSIERDADPEVPRSELSAPHSDNSNGAEPE